MNVKSAKFLTSATGLEDCPKSSMPEFAFIGRSNVGKSSLINLLTGKQGLAKVSSTPGKTKLINFFTINDSWSLVDLPGYGYARVSKGEQEGFTELIGDYLLERENLKQIYVLIDSRNEPMQIDLEFIAWLREADAPLTIIFTKVDKVSMPELQGNVNRFTQTLESGGVDIPKVLSSSSKDKLGRGLILSSIQKLLPKGKSAKKKKVNISLGWMKK
ncbi:ribosome biogenesis GTP-binding protein YihA/YsxC [Puniceicoccaceae bacterium K14]|nr:ribosome biogenesis GTP-binding protein YihA/YsxC [Puniceicoccaceae bacterium K14]